MDVGLLCCRSQQFDRSAFGSAKGQQYQSLVLADRCAPSRLTRSRPHALALALALTSARLTPNKAPLSNATTDRLVALGRSNSGTSTNTKKAPLSRALTQWITFYLWGL